MPEKPVIIVQLIHIEGPFKGKIEEYSDSVIRIGRNVDCQICFPKDLTIVSRNHAEIVREGNRFKLIDHSTNGTFVNGKAVKETFLKDGDVLIIGDGGPKVSFLTEIKAAGVEAFESASGILDEETLAFSPIPPVRPRPSSASEEKPLVQTPDRPATPSPKQSLLSQASVRQKPSMISEPQRRPDPAEARVQAPLVIQFGPTIQSFKMLPLIIGKKADCDFILNHADVIDRHLHIFFHENNYWVKDLTGQGLITINDTPIQVQTPLHPGSRLSLGPRGPVFQFLSGGRLAEVTGQPTEADSQESPNAKETPWQATPEPQHRRKGWLILLICFLVILIAVIVWLFFNPGTMGGTMAGGLKGWWHRLVEVIR